MLKPLCTLIALAFLAGCHRTTGSLINFTIDPNPTAQTATLTCNASSSDVCHFILLKDATTTIAKADIRTGSTITIRDVVPGATFCSSIHAASLDTCNPEPIPSHRSTIKREHKESPARSE